jgi:uncharacterized protein (TIGR03000 family)
MVGVGVLMLAGATLLMFPETSHAQRRGGGYRGGYRGGSAYWGGGYGGGYYGGGYYPFYGSSYYGSRYYSPWYSSGYYSPMYYGNYAPDYNYYSQAVPAESRVIYSSSSYTPSSDSSVTAPADDRAYVTVELPAKQADVWIEGQKSVQNKQVEDYVSPTLTPGKKYYYEVRARWSDANGKSVEETRRFSIHPGHPVLVDFTRSARQPGE